MALRKDWDMTQFDEHRTEEIAGEKPGGETGASEGGATVEEWEWAEKWNKRR